MREEAGDRADQDQRQQRRAEERRQPGPAQRAPPELACETARGAAPRADGPGASASAAADRPRDRCRRRRSRRRRDVAGCRDRPRPCSAGARWDRRRAGAVAPLDRRTPTSSFRAVSVTQSRLRRRSMAIPYGAPAAAARRDQLRRRGPIEKQRMRCRRRCRRPRRDCPRDHVRWPDAGGGDPEPLERVRVVDLDDRSRDGDDGDVRARRGDAARLLRGSRVFDEPTAVDDRDRVAALVADELAPVARPRRREGDRRPRRRPARRPASGTDISSSRPLDRHQHGPAAAWQAPGGARCRRAGRGAPLARWRASIESQAVGRSR